MGRVTTYFAILSAAVLALVACGGNVEEAVPVEQMPKAETMEATGDAAKVDYIVVSKESMRLRVFDTDNRLICSFGVALGRGEGDKHEVGDMCTPEGEFAVVAVEDASQWLYDDGSGAVEGFYGNYFIRLNSPFKGIGIYGTDDAAIIGTHSTEGSVRLINADLDSLRGLVREGMKVRIDAMDMRIAEARAVITDEKPAEEVAVVEEVAVAQEVQSAEKPAEAQVATGKEVWHKVADGELLGRIAIRYGTTVAEIKRLNPTINVDRISIGQRILVSDGSVAVKAAPKAEEAKAEVVEKDGEVWYTLQPGDLVGRVAMRYGTTTKRIAELNPDINVDKVRDGQRIRVK